MTVSIFDSGSGPLCSLVASDPAIMTLSCRVDYMASFVEPNFPILTWKSGTSGVPQKNSTLSYLGIDIPFGYLYGLESQIQIDSNDATRYECQVTFGPTLQKQYDFVTKTPPNFTASCSVSSE